MATSWATRDNEGVPSKTVRITPDDHEVQPDDCPEPEGNRHCAAVSPVDHVQPGPGTMPAASTWATMAVMEATSVGTVTAGADTATAAAFGTGAGEVVVVLASGSVPVVRPAGGLVVEVVAIPVGAADVVGLEDLVRAEDLVGEAVAVTVASTAERLFFEVARAAAAERAVPVAPSVATPTVIARASDISTRR